MRAHRSVCGHPFIEKSKTELEHWTKKPAKGDLTQFVSAPQNFLENPALVFGKIRILGILKGRGKGSTWSNLLSLAASYAAPDVGHAEALDTPDLSYVSWKATYVNKKKTPRKISRDNTVAFLEAAQNIYDHLKQVSPMPNNSKPWKDFARPLEDCLRKEEN